jgi:hypothetical protein
MRYAPDILASRACAGEYNALWEGKSHRKFRRAEEQVCIGKRNCAAAGQPPAFSNRVARAARSGTDRSKVSEGSGVPSPARWM